MGDWENGGRVDRIDVGGRILEKWARSCSVTELCRREADSVKEREARCVARPAYECLSSLPLLHRKASILSSSWLGTESDSIMDS